MHTPLPPDFLPLMQELLSEEYPAFLDSFTKDAQTAVRLHPQKGEGLFVEGTSVPWNHYGKILKERPSFTYDPLFHAGCYYVQDASSQFLSHLLSQLDPKKEARTILDLCAAPGGKSTALLDYYGKDALIVSNEVVKNRSRILEENITKWGTASSIITSLDPHFLGERAENFFDLIVVDAPCSGEGLFRKDKEARSEWSSAHMHFCAERQKRILRDIWPALKADGVLIYSTCTFNTEENEDILVWMQTELDARGLSFSAPEEWNISLSAARAATCARFLPHRVEGEGLTIGAVRKRYSEKSLPEKKKSPLSFAEVQDPWLTVPMSVASFGERILALHTPLVPFVQDFLSRSPVLRVGLPIAEKKRVLRLPPHDLALSPLLAQDAFPRVEVSLEDALVYLRKQPLTLPLAPDGLFLVCYNHHPLGFAKNVSHGINNLYPVNWRILR